MDLASSFYFSNTTGEHATIRTDHINLRASAQFMKRIENSSADHVLDLGRKLGNDIKILSALS
jgi:hypothetical protein